MWLAVLAMILTSALAALHSDGGQNANTAASTTAAVAGADILIGIIAMFVWKNKGGSRVVGFLWGFFLSLIGLVVVLVATPSAAKQPKP